MFASVKKIGTTTLVLFVFLTASFSQDNAERANTIGIPAVIFSPENGLGFGGAGLHLFHPDKKDTATRVSQIEGIFLYTTRRQILFSPQYQIFTPGENFYFSGKIEFLRFPEVYFGVGNNTPETNREIVEYTYTGFEHRFLKKIHPNLFTGIEVRHFRRFNIEFQEGGVFESSQIAGANGSVVTGAGPAILFDTRDKVTSSHKGVYLFASAFFHGNFLGGNFKYNFYQFDLRKYFKLFKNHDHILAVQALGNFNTGNAPFRELALLGGPNILRGYIRGRFRDNHLLAGQAEYRMPLFWRLGMVGFVGVGDVSNRLNEFSTNKLKYSYGTGLRFLVDKEERVSIRFDVGFGNESPGFYINFAEAF